ncbi:MAG: hypothetical protein JO317_04920 [Verrucomicrobiae bacterium]|nr:hypothetical protein [Verrucomicrobiae bacterium]
MRTSWKMLAAMTVLISSAAVFAASEKCSESEKCPVKPPAASRELERMKSLAGRWEGTSPHGPMTVEYQVTSGGSAVVEKLAPGTPNEMVSVYHDSNGKLAMTHYCMLGNQPRLVLEKADAKRIKLDFDDDQEINPKRDDHMHAVTIEFKDRNHIVESWQGYHGGKLAEPMVIKLSRKS